ncbi:MAG: cold shock domain-containing protein [Mariniblastus sp.]|nr:cold shock domain-containing protein [Mariniblastus sp.]
MKRISILGLGCLLICSLTSPSTFAQDKTEMSDSQTARGKGVVKFFNNTKGFGYISDGDGDQDSNEVTSRGGGVKFFNNTKGFGYISDDQEMDWLLERVAAMCGGPVTGCTFEVMDILRDIFGSN